MVKAPPPRPSAGQSPSRSYFPVGNVSSTTIEVVGIPSGFMKLAEPVLALQAQIGQSDPGAARAPVDGVVAHRGDHSHRHSVHQSVEHIGQRAETVRTRGAAPNSLTVVVSDHDHVVEVGLGVGNARAARSRPMAPASDGPPCIVERLAGDQRRRRTLLSAGEGGHHRQDGNGSVDGAPLPSSSSHRYRGARIDSP